MMEEYIRHFGLKNVTVSSYEGATIRYAERVGANLILKGLRNASDLQAEMEQAVGNRGMNEATIAMLHRGEIAEVPVVDRHFRNWHGFYPIAEVGPPAALVPALIEDIDARKWPPPRPRPRPARPENTDQSAHRRR